jgi:hypothetical protein
MFQIIFCADPLNQQNPDPVYEAEVKACSAIGIEFSLINFEALVYEGNTDKAIRRVKERSVEMTGIYRGWMLKPDQYATLYQALLTRGIRLINDPATYKYCHYLPDSYLSIQALTARSIWLPVPIDNNFDPIMNALRLFGSSPIVVKDYVKSQKHYWHEAFYIPSASKRDVVQRVVSRFIQLQGSDLNEGLVFREFVELEPIGNHTKSGMPLTREYRIFFLNGNPLYSAEYWDADYQDNPPSLNRFIEVAKTIRSHFFTMDIAKRLNDDWIIVELGDGQVAGLPDNTDPLKFYEALQQANL